MRTSALQREHLPLGSALRAMPPPPAVPASPVAPSRVAASAPRQPQTPAAAAGRASSSSSSSSSSSRGNDHFQRGLFIVARAAEATAAAAASDLQEELVAAPLQTEGAELLQGVSRRAAAPGAGGRSFTAAEVFQCAEESLFYSQALEKLLPIAVQRHAQRGGGGIEAPPAASASNPSSSARGNSTSGAEAGSSNDGAIGGGSSGSGCSGSTGAAGFKVVEFGTGDGTPVVNALMKTKFDGVVHGFELNPTSAELAREHAAAFGLQDRYQVHTGCFYAGTRSPGSPAAGAGCLVSNPPYLPAPDADILMPELHGGSDGAGLTRDLLSLRYPYAMLLVASYSNPAAVLRHAAAAGYRVVDFLVTPLPFGTYSSQPKVRNWIAAMRARGEAFYSGNTYLLAGVLFERTDLPPQQQTTTKATKAPQQQQTARRSNNGHSANGNGHNGNGHNGNGHDGNGTEGALTVYHTGVEQQHQQQQGAGQQGLPMQKQQGEEDLAPQLLRLLTAL
ncbi:hypothetical protein HYH02_000690 [Chlamydomonas schloesseri]|uniref:Uncharacterized protein n=1 Tax=Chlamydomonas schloesseri TaxID=2026947 RepID=A0A835WV41_9CHLO|nr:hypothetical protein HYH02_000690 [Chlamydomonas schloesseri]|eukprot:KAG2454859.1 hypothetical protein HYH02_000690 [Chlamydomonas schloesseri]